MRNKKNELIECDYFHLEVSAGNIHKFPKVDNKGLFLHFRKTEEDFKYRLETLLTEALPVFAIYKKEGCFSVLVCAFSSQEEINNEAMAIVQSSEKIRKSFEGLLEHSK